MATEVGAAAGTVGAFNGFSSVSTEFSPTITLDTPRDVKGIWG